MDQPAPPAARASSPPDYFPQLDGLRAMAVLAVMQHHWVPGITRGVPFSTGNAGVQLFFVISGFLITGILLRARARAADRGFHIVGVLKAFYARRFLRIFPLYYGVIAVLLLIAYPPVLENFWWLVTYTFNIRLALLGEWVPGISPFWSLAVEEQFYLFWPFLVLFFPRRGLVTVCWVLVVAAPLMRIGHHTLFPEHFNGLLLFEATDSLCFGALLAVYGPGGGAARRLSRIGLWAGGALVLLCSLLILMYPVGGDFLNTVSWSLQQLGMVAWLTWLVWSAAIGLPGWIGRLLSNKAIVFIGTISYGLYVYHLLIMQAWPGAVDYLGLPDGFFNGGLRLLGLLVVTFGVATLSWYLFERPINRRKVKFPYVPPDTGNQPARLP